MRVVYVCTDAGIPPFGRKGASVHVQAILDRLLAQGHEVHLVTPRPGPVPPHLAGLHVHPLPAPEGDDPRSREAAARATDRRVAVLLDRIRASGPVDMVYERYALWGRTAMAWARAHAIASVLEVNAPLPLEQARHRRLADRAAADAVAQLRDSGRRGRGVRQRSRSPAGCTVSAAPTLGPRRPQRRRHAPVPTAAAGATGHRRSPCGFVGTLKPWHGVQDLVEAIALLHRQDPWPAGSSSSGTTGAPAPSRTSSTRYGLTGAVELTGAVDPSRVPAQAGEDGRRGRAVPADRRVLLLPPQDLRVPRGRAPGRRQ